jgi:hypothetical protein
MQITDCSVLAGPAPRIVPFRQQCVHERMVHARGVGKDSKQDSAAALPYSGVLAGVPCCATQQCMLELQLDSSS